MTDKIEKKSEFPRVFVPVDADLGDWAQIEPLLDALQNGKCETVGDLEAHLLKVSELAACIDEEGSRRYIAMTCDTADAEKERRHLEFVETIEPSCAPRWHALNEKLVASPAFDELPDERYFVLKRSVRSRVDLFREENVPLDVEVAKLSQEYQKITGSMMVNFRGREHTMQEMGTYLEEQDRPTRREAWETTVKRRLEEKEKLEDLFDRMLRVRVQIAANAGYDNFRDYTFAAYQRFDYTPDDCAQFHDAVQRCVLPALHAIHEKRRADLGVEALRPWDLAVDPKNQPPLKPFAKPEELVAGCAAVFEKIDGELSEGFQRMEREGRLDLGSRAGKAPGGYQANLAEVREPFIFMNAVGLQGDVNTLLHEGGHAFHALLARDEPLVEYRSAPMEFCEVASMSMELLGHPHLDAFYGAADHARATCEHMEKIVELFPWIATVDAFQMWLYTHPDHSRDERRQAWHDLRKRFGGLDDWSGYEAESDYLWHRQLHIFLAPFYYIEYGIAQIGALQVWRRALDDAPTAFRDYKAALALAGSKPLPDLFARAGIRFDFSADTIGPLVDAVTARIGGA